MTGRGLETRIAKLERVRGPTASYVVSVSDPPTSDELAELARARAECESAWGSGADRRHKRLIDMDSAGGALPHQ